jgi:hypothetical protein
MLLADVWIGSIPTNFNSYIAIFLCSTLLWLLDLVEYKLQLQTSNCPHCGFGGLEYACGKNA